MSEPLESLYFINAKYPDAVEGNSRAFAVLNADSLEHAKSLVSGQLKPGEIIAPNSREINNYMKLKPGRTEVIDAQAAPTPSETSPAPNGNVKSAVEALKQAIADALGGISAQVEVVGSAGVVINF